MTGSLTPVAVTAASWLLTYALHSTILLAGAWLVARLLAGRRVALEELVWRTAVLGGVLTATLQVGLGVGVLNLAGPAPQRTPAVVAAIPAADAVAPPAAPGDAASTAAESAEETPAPIWPWALLLPWLAGAGLGALRLRHAARDLRMLLADRLPVVNGPLAAALNHLLRLLPRPPDVALSSSRALPVPVAVGVRRPEICVPERVLAELPSGQQEGLCAHELAHVVRRDPAWSLLLGAIDGVLFIQPLNRVARLRLAELAELCCDDWAVSSTGRHRDLARCLATVAEWGQSGGRCPLPAASLLGSSRLTRRVRRLLEPDGSGGGVRHPRGALAAAGGALLALAVVLPGVSAARPASAAGDHPEEPTPQVVAEAPPAPPAPEVAQPVAPTDTVAAPAAPTPPAAATAVPAPPAPPASQEQVTAREHAKQRQQAREATRQRARERAQRDDEVDPETRAEMERLEAEIDRLSSEIERRVTEHMEGVQLPDEATLKRIEKQRQQQEELARKLEKEMALVEVPEVDTSRLEAEMDRLAEKLEQASREGASDAEQAQLRKELAERARAMAERLRPSQEQLKKLQEKAQAMAEAMRPSQEELRLIAEQARQIAEQVRPDQEELKKLQQQLQERAERLRELAQRIAKERYAAPHPAPAPQPEEQPKQH